MDVVIRETPVEAIEACKQGNAEGNGDVEPLMLFGGLELTFVRDTLHQTDVETNLVPFDNLRAREKHWDCQGW